MTTQLCPDSDLEQLMAAIQTDGDDDLRRLDRSLQQYPSDPRLQFLRGSLLASIGRPIEALSALRRAVELEPDFHIARFQLGFFQLTSGEALAALETWGPIALLPDNHYLRFFVGGLTHLIRDEFADAELRLREGIGANQENIPLNRDMQMLIDKINDFQAGDPTSQESSNQSATSFLLQQLGGQGLN